MKLSSTRAVLVWTVPVAGLLLRCSASPEEQGAGTRSSQVKLAPAAAAIAAATTVVAASSASVVPGYQHTLAVSKIHLGPNVHTEQTASLTRWVGDDGAFSVSTVNGLVFAAQSSTSPAYLAAPCAGGFEAHKDLVRTYFLSDGLPADQVRGVAGFSKARQHGPAGALATAPPSIVGYSSTVARAVAGYPVVESFAEAQFNVNGEVVREVVYWPEFSSTLVDDARALSVVLADPVGGPSYLASLPAQGDPTVAIHHSVDSLYGFVAFASCDVATRHFNLAGAELRLPEESRIASSPPTTRAPQP